MKASKTQVLSCIRCDKRMWHVFGNSLNEPRDEFDVQPDAGIVVQANGNYGSTYFDPWPGETDQYLLMILCDECARSAVERGQIKRHYNSHGE